MSDYPFERILAFMRTLPPFGALEEDKLKELVSLIEIAFYPSGERIVSFGQPSPPFLFIVQTGSAKATTPTGDEQEGELLVDIVEEGRCFGHLAMIQGGNALFNITAREDTICYLLPAEAFRKLMDENLAFKRYFSFSLARDMKAAQDADPTCQIGQVAGLASVGMDAALVRSTVRDLMSTEVLSCLPAVPVAQAAKLMTERQVGSMVVVEEQGAPLGIITDSDLRIRVLAQGNDSSSPVAAFMSYPVRTISPQIPAYEALLQMSRHGVHHLVATENDRVVGLISDHDLHVLAGTSPISVARDIDKVSSVEELVRLHVRIDRVLEMLLRQGGSAKSMLQLVTEFNDRLTRKLLSLIENQMSEQGLGRAPVPFCWVALGSEGRREQTLRTDQDNALIYANVPAEREKKIKGWFLKFADRMAMALERCGFPLCQGGIMARNPRWCQSERQWQQTFLDWVNDPNPETLRLSSIFFDFRSIYTEADFLEKLGEVLGRAIEGNRLFLRYMAQNGLYNRPPLGFFRQFVLLKDGEHKNKLNLKLSGLTPMVDGARVLALEQGVQETNTIARLEEAARLGVLPKEMAGDLLDAFSFITVLRVRHHLEARARGEVPDNFVNPDILNSMQRKMLKESFEVISRFQELLEHRYQTDVMN